MTWAGMTDDLDVDENVVDDDDDDGVNDGEKRMCNDAILFVCLFIRLFVKFCATLFIFIKSFSCFFQ